ncbi:hypothetical protein BJX70DRAFT_370274, partial [Aspergillus crustosus]
MGIDTIAFTIVNTHHTIQHHTFSMNTSPGNTAGISEQIMNIGEGGHTHYYPYERQTQEARVGKQADEAPDEYPDMDVDADMAEETYTVFSFLFLTYSLTHPSLLHHAMFPTHTDNVGNSSPKPPGPKTPNSIKSADPTTRI